MPDDAELNLSIPRWMISRVREARSAVEEALAAFDDVQDRGHQNAAERTHKAAEEERARAEAMLLREVLARASKVGA